MQNGGEGSGEVSILLVEDEEVSRGSLSRMLGMRYSGIRIYTAENGRSGLDLYRRHLPEVVISDISMPQLNGIDMAREIRAEDPQARIIFLSAHSEAQHLLDAQDLGVPHFVMKPVDRHELFEVIGRCLDERSGFATAARFSSSAR